MQQPLQGQAVAPGTETHHHTDGPIGEQGAMAKGFPGMGVAEMQLHIGDRNPQQGIPQSDRGVGMSPGIDQDALAPPHGLVNLLHQGPLEIALKAIQGHVGRLRFGLQVLLDRRQGAASIDSRLPLAQQIQIGSVQQQQMHGASARNC